MGFDKQVFRLGVGEKPKEINKKLDFRHKSCDGKKKYTSLAEAEDASAMVAQHNKANGDTDRMNAYYCRFCTGWHVGHAKKNLQ